MATKFTISQRDAEVSGLAVLGYMNCIEQDEVRPLLAKHGIAEVDPNAWYLHQTLLDILREIEQGGSNVAQSLVSIGVKVMEDVVLPPSINSIPAILESLGVVYHMYHRNVTEMGWSAKTLGERHILVTHDSPYPNDLAYGIVWSSVRRFLPSGWQFKVVQSEPAKPDDPVFYDVEWGPTQE